MRACTTSLRLLSSRASIQLQYLYSPLLFCLFAIAILLIPRITTSILIIIDTILTPFLGSLLQVILIPTIIVFYFLLKVIIAALVFDILLILPRYLGLALI